MLANDKKKYGVKPRHQSDTGQDPNVEQSPEVQLQPRSQSPEPQNQPQQKDDQIIIENVLRFSFEFRGVIIAEFFWSIIGLF